MNIDRRAFIAGSSAFLASCSGGSIATVPLVPGDAAGNFGSTPDPVGFTSTTLALPPEALDNGVTTMATTPLPSRVVLPNLPPVSKQGISTAYGSPGTCEAQSFAYGLGSYTAAQSSIGVFKYQPTTPDLLISPAWMFSWGTKTTNPTSGSDWATCPSGGYSLPYLDLLVSTGAASVAEVPYNPSGTTSLKAFCDYIAGISITPPPDAARFRIGGYKSLGVVTNKMSTLLTPMKKLIAKGQAIAFSGKVAGGYPLTSPPLDNGVFYGDGTASGGHGQLIVGYDDTIGDATKGVGAFLVQNSFSTAWNPGDTADPGRNGRIWFSYALWFAIQGQAAVAYPIDLDATPGVSLTPSVTGAPAVAILRAHDWADTSNNRHVLVLTHRFATAMTLKHLSVTDPNGKTFEQDHGGDATTGYVYVQRTDGAFPSGTHTVRLTLQTADGTSVVYSGSIAVPT